MMENCEHCRWRKDLIKCDYSQGYNIRTRQEGYACLALTCDEEVIWMVGVSQFNARCEMFTPKEE